MRVERGYQLWYRTQARETAALQAWRSWLLEQAGGYMSQARIES
ncbi:MAG TPA: hypothetical protein VNO84_15925 [Burkholderiaceae bacterium]|nr:hypothetical protein [Burkholderiaceae bacterium]